MNKNIIIIITIFIVILAICYIWFNENTNKYKQLQNKNYEYEQYKKNEIYGTDIISLINKATNENEKNGIQKDEKGLYIENQKNSIIIEVVMIIDEEKQQTKNYRMETISKVGISSFINNFNTAKFKMNNIEYHKETGKIKKIILEQQYD